MQLPNWSRNLLLRRRRQREKSARQQLFAPVRLSLRKLEERRVLDVSAAFMTGTGVLELDVTNTSDVATLQESGGDISIRDAGNNSIDIEVDGGTPMSVALSDVKRIVVHGDGAAGQEVVIDTPLAPMDGVFVDSSIELTVINDPITRVGNNGIALNSLSVQLGADLEAPGLDITFGGDVRLASDVSVTASNVVFEGMVDDDGDLATNSNLTVNADGLTLFVGKVGSNDALDGIKTDAAGHSEINADINASGNTITFNDPVVLTNSVSLTDTGTTGIRFNDTVDSASDAQHSLTATATNGRVTFSGDIGDGAAGDQSLGSLTITEAAEGVIFGDMAGVAQIRTANGGINIGSVAGGIGGVGIQLNGGAGNLLTITTSGGNVRWNAATALVTDVDVFTDGGTLTLTADAPLDSQPNAVRKLKVNAGSGAVEFNEDIGRAVPLRGLEISRADAGVTFGGANVETPGMGGSGPVTLINSTGPVLIGSTDAIGGSGVVFNAGANSTLRIVTTSDNVTINGAVKLQSNVSINTGNRGGDITFTDASPIDNQAAELKDLTLAAGEGSVFLDQNVGSDPIGKLTVTRAFGGVTIGTDASPVTIVHAARGIDIGVGSNQVAGSGIVLNGGTGTLTLETNNTNIRLNGPTTLAANVLFDTDAGIGDVTLTGDTPVDSETGEFNDLSFNLGAGAVFINEDLGRTNRLGSLTVLTAGGGAIFGQATTEVPGAGGTGPVEIINTEGEIRIGETSAIGGVGVVFRGSAIARSTITTTADDVLVNGPTTLGTDLTVKTSSGGGNLTFTGNSTVDGVTGITSSLTLDLGDGALFFNADVGSSTALGRLTVVSAKSGVTFGDSDAVNLVRASQPIDIGVGTNVIDGGISLNGGSSEMLIATLNAHVRLNGHVRAQSDVAIDTGDGGGAITLTSSATVDSDDGPINATNVERNSIRLDAGKGSISVNANFGSQQRLGAFTVERADGGVVIGGADTSSTGGAGPVTEIATDGPINIGSTSVIAGGIELNSGGATLLIDAAAANIDFNGPIELQSNVEINTGAVGGDLTLSGASTLNSQSGEANGIAITLGTGNAIFGAAVGALNPLGELRVATANDVTAKSEVNAGRLVQQAGSGTTTFDGAINTTSPSLSGIDLVGNAFVFNGLVMTTGDGRVSIIHSSVLDINASADMRLEGAFDESGTGSVEIAADIVTSGDAIHFGSPVTLTDGVTADVLFDTTSSGNAAGADIVFDATVNAQNVGAESLTLNAGTSGSITLGAAVGDVTRAGHVRIIEANDVTFSGSLVADGISQDAGHGFTAFNGTVNTNDVTAAGIDINTTDVSFLDAVSTLGDGRVEVTVTGVLDIGAAANLSLSGAFAQDGGGSVQMSADITTSDDDISFADEVTVRESVRFDTDTGAGNLLFASTLNGTNDCLEDMTLAIGTGNASFQSAVGSSVGLGDILIDDAADVRFDSTLRASSIKQSAGTGETRFDGAVTLKTATGVDVTTGSVTINNTFDTSTVAGPINIAASDEIAVNGSVTSGNATVQLSADDDILFGGAGAVTTTGADVTIHADADASVNGSGGAVLMNDGAGIETGAGVIDVGADENIQLGRLVTTSLVRLTSTSGSVVDGGNSGGADIVADRLAIRASTGVGTVDPLDTSVNTIAVENKRSGGVRFENATGGSLSVGDVDGLSGIMNGPIGVPEKLVGDVEVIHVGAINVVAPILNDGGSHTIVRAELPGDLTIDAPIQNRGGNGWIFLFSGGDLVINHSLPEPEAEISVENEGAIRGEARGDVIIDNTDTDYVIVRTHSERFPNATTLPTLSAKFVDPARYPDETDTAFYTELEAELRVIRESISGQATNFSPIFDIEAVDQGGSDVDSNGRGIVKITIGDSVHLETNWHFTINWGDGNIENYSIPGNPQASLAFLTANNANTNIVPDLTNMPRIDSGVGGEPGVYYVHHKYLSPPDPSDPAAPTPISAELRYDAREEGEQALDLGRPDDGSGIFNGIRFFRNGTEPVISTDEDVLTNPGEGAFFAIKIVESVIIPVESRQSTTVYVATSSTTTTVASGSTFEFVAASFEAETFEDYRLFMRVVDDVIARAKQTQAEPRAATAGEGMDEYALPLDLLNDPLSIFRERKFPNGHYRIYLEEIRTGRIRLILDVHIYEGRVVPENFRDGAAERQPGSDDSSQLESASNPLASTVTKEADFVVEAGRGEMTVVRAVATNDAAEATASDSTDTPRRSSLLLPVAVATLPWRSRVRKALQSQERSISRASLRLRRHR